MTLCMNEALKQATTRAEVAEQERDQANLWLNTQARELDAARRDLVELQRYRDRTEAALLELCRIMELDAAARWREGDTSEDGWRDELRAFGLYRPVPLPAEVPAQPVAEEGRHG